MALPLELDSISDGATRSLASEILAREEYAQYRSLPHAWLRQLLEQIARLFRLLPHLYDVSPVLYLAVLSALSALAVLLVGHVIWSLRAALRTPSAASIVPAHKSRDFLAEARTLAQTGSYLEASHRLLLATLAHAAQIQVLELKPDDGNRVVCDKLRAADLPPVLRQRLITLIELTDAVWFGTRLQSVELYEAWQSTYEQLRSAR